MSASNNDTFFIYRTASVFRGYLNCYRILPLERKLDPADYLAKCSNMIKAVCNFEKTNQIALKLWCCLMVAFEKTTDEEETVTGYFPTRQLILLTFDDIEHQIPRAVATILEGIESFEQKGSDWVVSHVVRLDLHCARYQPLRAASYVALPSYLQAKKAIINIKNTDNRCFMWAVLAALHPQSKNAERVIKYLAYEQELDFRGINFPVSHDKISRFESQNNLSINVYGFENFLYPLYISKESTRHINLLLYNGHYCWIKNINRLLADQNKHNGQKYYCYKCLVPTYSAESLEKHLVNCSDVTPTKIRLPSPDNNSLKFIDFKRKLRKPIVVYADCECLTQQISTAEQNPSLSSTNPYQKHTPCSFGYIVSKSCCDKAKFEEPICIHGKDCTQRFLEAMISIAEAWMLKTRNIAPLYMNQLDELIFKNRSNCHICERQLIGERVRDHCHVCGRFRGPAHPICNQAYTLQREIVIVFHNLRRYDSHIIMQEIAGVAKKHKLDLHCIAKGSEDYITFSVTKRAKLKRQLNQQRESILWRMRFVDSFQFMSSSLESLVDHLAEDDFKAISKHFSSDQTKLLLRKQVYPYDYMNSWDKFTEESLPALAQFYSQLNCSSITDEQYEHANNVWKHFKCKTLLDYHDLYLRADVLQLADVFERFREFCLQYYGLDPCHYCTLPGLAWDACLKLTGVTLELITCSDMYKFFESGIRGGISMISHRYAKANNASVEGYDPSISNSFILYLDANNLYGYSMCQPLPIGDFTWLTETEIEVTKWSEISKENEFGYILEVDLDYPPYLHDLHNDYPLAPEQKDITLDMLSPYSLYLRSLLNLKSAKTTKLVPNLMKKRKYVVHHRNLQLYLRLGLELVAIHRVLRFRQTKWLEQYILFNTEKRKIARTTFEKDQFKLLNNAVFGKTMEDKRNHQDVRLVTDPKHFLKLVKSPLYQRSVVFSGGLTAVCMRRKETMLNKPISVGFTVLELSKELMYSFHYDFIKSKYEDYARLLFTDTDSLCYKIETEDVYRDLSQHSSLFDFSDYPEGHILFSDVNKKVPGKFKDETASVAISEFAGLRSKMYSFLCNNKETKKAKGVKKRVVSNEIRHRDYVETLSDENLRRNKMNLIRSKNHEIYTIALRKISLSPYDDKRYLLDDGITSFAYGHHLI